MSDFVKSRRHRCCSLLLCGALMAVIGGCGGGATESSVNNSAPAALPPPPAGTSAAGASPVTTQDADASAEVAETETVELTYAPGVGALSPTDAPLSEIAAAFALRVPSRPTASVSEEGGLTLAQPVPSVHDGAWIRGFWEGMLVMGAIADQLRVNSAEGSAASVKAVQSFMFLAVTPDGKSEEFPQQGGGTKPNQDWPTIDRDRAEATVRVAATRLGLYDVSIEFIDVVDTAIAITAYTKDPLGAIGALEVDGLVELLGGQPFEMYEGFYLEVRDPDGVVVARRSATYRAGAVSGWLAEKYGGGQPRPRE